MARTSFINDNDGFLDLVVACLGGPNLFYHNNGNSNSWLKVKLEGTASNRSGIGAKVRVQATIRGQQMWQMREITGNSGWDGGNPALLAHFGLGDATNVQVLRVEWPSGTVQELTNLPARQQLLVTEPVKLKMLRPGELQTQGWNGMTLGLECSPDLVTWLPLVTVTNRTAHSLVWTDPDMSSRPSRFYRVRGIDGSRP